MTSALGGYIQGATAAPHGVQFEDFVQACLVGLSGLPGASVRPRWQAKPPRRPTGDWLAFGIAASRSDDRPYQHHESSGQGLEVVTRHEEIDFLISCYGTNPHQIAARIRDNLYIRQNREAMFLAGAGLVEARNITITADLINDQWLPRADLVMTLRRAIQRTYPILNLLIAHGDFVLEDGTIEHFTTE